MPVAGQNTDFGNNFTRIYRFTVLPLFYHGFTLPLLYCITLKSPNSSGSCAQNFWALRWCSAGKPNSSRIASSSGWSGRSGLKWPWNTWKVSLKCLNAAFAGDSRNEWCKSSVLTFQMDMPATSNGRTASGLICMSLLHIMHYYALIPEYGSPFSRMFKVNEWSSESLLVQVPSLLKCGHGIAIDHQFLRTSKHFEIWLNIFGFWALPTNPATPPLTTNVEVLGSCSHSRHRYLGFGKVECQDKRKNRLRIGWQLLILPNKVQVVGGSSSLDWVVKRMWVAHTRPEGQLR